MTDPYEIEMSTQLTELLARVDQLTAEINAHRSRPDKEQLWGAVHEKLRVEWTYHSNAIEGSSLTLGDTIFFLREGLTVEGKPFKDFLDARNHAQAIDLLHEWVSEGRAVSEGLLEELNAVLLAGVTSTPAIDALGRPTNKPATPGAYKRLPNTVVQFDGTVHRYVDPLQVPGEMERLCAWINEQLDRQHPVVTAAVGHYNFVRIHPFDDGNGRGARILMNLILLRKGHPVAVIQNERRREYLELLGRADSGELTPFVEFVAESLTTTQRTILDVLER